MIQRIILLCASALTALAQQPAISNADLKQVSAAGGLDATVKTSIAGAAGPVWIGYAMPAIPGEHNNGCCWTDNSRGCGLEGGVVSGNVAASATPVRLEGPSHVVVLMRYEQGVAERLRVFSPDCPLDAGGRPFFWLSGVKPADSIAFLTSWMEQRQTQGTRSGVDSAISAVALHAAPEAEAALVKMSSSSASEESRRRALFWLAKTRGKTGYDIASKAAREDASEKVREHAVFALTQSKQPEAIPDVIRIAREDKSPRVRKQAMFWLGQSRDRRAVDFFEQVLAK